MSFSNWRTIAAVIAVSAATLTATQQATAAPRYVVQDLCPRTFTVHMIKRAIASVYNGDQVPTPADHRMLQRYWKCSRYPASMQYERHVWNWALSDNWKRRHPPVAQPESELASCIIYRESRGDPEADNGSHFGIAQMTLTLWAQTPGLKYGPSPLDANYSEQVSVLNWCLDHGMADNWTPYDGC